MRAVPLAWPRGALLVLGVVVLPVLAACDDDPFRVPWFDSPEEATLFTLDRPEQHVPTALDMHGRRTVRIQAPEAENRWDFALERSEGRLFILPAGALGVENRAGVVPVPGVAWEDVREAPRDTADFRTSEPVPVEEGTIYVVRTHEQPGQFGRICVFFGKVEPVSLDVERGAFTFRFDSNPQCNNRNLVPDEG